MVVPTIFPQTSTEEMFEAGFKVIIYANQAIRSAVSAMQDTLRTIVQSGNAHSVNNQIITLQEVFELIGVAELEAMEKEYLMMKEGT